MSEAFYRPLDTAFEDRKRVPVLSLVDNSPVQRSKTEQYDAVCSEADVQSHPRDHCQPSTWSSLTTDRWLWEAGGIFVSLAGIASIRGLLIAYDNEPAPELPYGITVREERVEVQDVLA